MYSSFIPANFFINTFPVYVMHNSKQDLHSIFLESSCILFLFCSYYQSSFLYFPKVLVIPFFMTCTVMFLWRRISFGVLKLEMFSYCQAAFCALLMFPVNQCEMKQPGVLGRSWKKKKNTKILFFFILNNCNYIFILIFHITFYCGVNDRLTWDIV